MDRGAWQGIVHRVAELGMTEVTLHACMHNLLINNTLTRTLNVFIDKLYSNVYIKMS